MAKNTCIWTTHDDFQAFEPKSQGNSNTYIIGFQNNIDTTSKTPKTTPLPSAHIEAVGFIGYMGEVFDAYLIEIHENSYLHLKSYQSHIDATIKFHKNTKFPHSPNGGRELSGEKEECRH